MNRRYTKEEFREAVKIIRKRFKDVMLTADIIVGFPGETEKEFNETYKFLEEIQFYKIHVFKYSQREGTKAADMPNQVLPEVKEERSRKVIELSNKIQQEYNKKYIGRQVEVLIEEKQGKYYKGHTENYMLVEIKTEKQDIENRIISIKIEDTKNEILLREIKLGETRNTNVIKM